VSLSWDDFARVDMRVGVVVDAREFPEARRPAFKLWIDFGPLGVKRSSAQVTHRYTPTDLVGRRVVAVVNFPPKQVGPFVSEVLVLGAYGETGEIVLLRPDFDVEPGARIGCALSPESGDEAAGRLESRPGGRRPRRSPGRRVRSRAARWTLEGARAAVGLSARGRRAGVPRGARGTLRPAWMCRCSRTTGPPS
jgi:tRNA-binding protein